MASETETPRWKKEKTRLESLSDEDRRANYFCNDDFIGLSDIPTWKEYFEQHEKSLTEKGIIFKKKLFIPTKEKFWQTSISKLMLLSLCLCDSF